MEPFEIFTFLHIIYKNPSDFFVFDRLAFLQNVLGGGWGRKFFVFVSGKNWCFRICMCEMVITICQTHFAVAENWVVLVVLICIGDAKNENANNNTFLLFANAGELQLLFLLLLNIKHH